MASAHEEPSGFIVWLQSELDKRKWSRNRLAQESDVYPSLFSKAWSGEQTLGPVVLRRVADALGISQVEVFRRAGLIDEQTVAGDELAELGRLLARIPDSERPRILHSLETMLKDLGESYVETKGDSAGDEADAAGDPARADP